MFYWFPLIRQQIRRFAYPDYDSDLRFESSVILEDSKTKVLTNIKKYVFESSVILEDSKTIKLNKMPKVVFESSVILEDSKTKPKESCLHT